MRVRRVWGCAVVLVSLGLVGCGGEPKPVPVKGVLSWEDGTPIDGASIVFAPDDSKGKVASGVSAKDGTFSLSTSNPGDGALPGTYKVTVTHYGTLPGGPAGSPEDMLKMMQQNKGQMPAPKNALPALYSSPASTPLTCTVVGAQGPVDLKLKKG